MYASAVLRVSPCSAHFIPFAPSPHESTNALNRSFGAALLRFHFCLLYSSSSSVSISTSTSRCVSELRLQLITKFLLSRLESRAVVVIWWWSWGTENIRLFHWFILSISASIWSWLLCFLRLLLLFLPHFCHFKQFHIRLGRLLLREDVVPVFLPAGVGAYV